MHFRRILLSYVVNVDKKFLDTSLCYLATSLDRNTWTRFLSSNFVDSIKRFQVLEPDVNSQSLFLSNRQKLYIYGYVVCKNNHLTIWHQMIEIYKCLNYQGFKVIFCLISMTYTRECYTQVKAEDYSWILFSAPFSLHSNFHEYLRVTMQVKFDIHVGKIIYYTNCQCTANSCACLVPHYLAWFQL